MYVYYLSHDHLMKYFGLLSPFAENMIEQGATITDTSYDKLMNFLRFRLQRIHSIKPRHQ